MGQQIPNQGGQLGNQINPMGNQMQMNAMGVQGQQMGQMNNMVPMNMNPGMQQNPMNVRTSSTKATAIFCIRSISNHH